MEPDNDDAITGLASIYSDRGNPKAGADLLEQLNKKNASPRTLIALASEYEQMHDYEKAADAYKRAIDLDPSRGELEGAMAQDLALAGQYDEALKAYQAFADANNQSPEPFIGMAQVYRQQQQLERMRRRRSTKRKRSIRIVSKCSINEVLLLQDEGKMSGGDRRV